MHTKKVLLAWIAGVLAMILTAGIASAQVKITFATRDVREPYAEIVAAFNQSHPDIEVEFLPLHSDEYVTQMLTMFASGVGPDVFFVYEADILSWASQGLLAPLDDFLAKDTELTRDAIYEGTWDAMTLGGQIYGISEYVNPNGLVWFNKTMYEEAGLESPISAQRRGAWTMETLRENARKLTRFSPDGGREALGLHIPNWWGPIYSFLMSNGFRFSDGDGNLALNTDANLRAVEYLREWTVEDRSTNVHEWPDEAGMLRDKRLGMVISGGWFTWVIPVIDPIEVDVVVMPEGIDGSRAAMISNPAIAMNPNSRHQDAAWTFMKYILVGEGARVRALAEGDLPSAKHLATLVEGSGPSWQEAMGRSMEWAAPMPSELLLRPGSMELMLYGDTSLEAVWRGDADAKPILDEIQRLASAIPPIAP